MKKYIKTLQKITVVASALLLNLAFTPVYAGSLTSVSDTQTRLKEGVASNHEIKFTLTAGTTVIQNETITITFPSAYSATLDGIDCGDIDLMDDAAQETMATTGGGCTATTTAWGASVSTRVLTLTAPSNSATYIDGSSVVTIKIGTNAIEVETGNTQIVNPATEGTYVISIGGGFGDTGSFAVAILDAANDDQVAMSATVDPSITFALSVHTSNFDTLAPGVVDTANTNITLTVGTNAAGGYTVNVKDVGNGTNGGLWASAASSIIGSADASYNATGDLDSVAVGYGIQASCTAGCTTNPDVQSDFRQAANTVGRLRVTDDLLVNYTSSLSADHTIQVVHKAKAGTYTKAGSYTDIITYIATGRF